MVHEIREVTDGQTDRWIDIGELVIGLHFTLWLPNLSHITKRLCWECWQHCQASWIKIDISILIAFGIYEKKSIKYSYLRIMEYVIFCSFHQIKYASASIYSALAKSAKNILNKCLFLINLKKEEVLNKLFLYVFLNAHGKPIFLILLLRIVPKWSISISFTRY